MDWATVVASVIGGAMTGGATILGIRYQRNVDREERRREAREIDRRTLIDQMIASASNVMRIATNAVTVRDYNEHRLFGRADENNYYSLAKLDEANTELLNLTAMAILMKKEAIVSAVNRLTDQFNITFSDRHNDERKKAANEIAKELRFILLVLVNERDATFGVSEPDE